MLSFKMQCAFSYDTDCIIGSSSLIRKMRALKQNTSNRCCFGSGYVKCRISSDRQLFLPGDIFLKRKKFKKRKTSDTLHILIQLYCKLKYAEDAQPQSESLRLVNSTNSIRLIIPGIATAADTRHRFIFFK